jgi:Uncharacterized conserved protein (DUF2285)
MPNWRNLEDYRYTASLTFQQWAWEFLRRSRAYRELWDAHDAFWKQAESNGLKAGDEISIPEWFFEGGKALGLAGHLPGPEVPAYQVPNLKWSLGLRLLKVSRADLPNDPAVAAFAFNLALPIDRQIEEVMREVRMLKREYDEAGHPSLEPPSIRFREEQWTRYLQLLDAKLAGESISGMGRALFGDTSNDRQNAQSALRKAEQFSASDYRQLLFMTDPKAPHLRPEAAPIRSRLVRILLGSDWGTRRAGEVVEVDSVRGDWLVANIPGSRLADQDGGGE